jgi:hypothetical protein
MSVGASDGRASLARSADPHALAVYFKAKMRIDGQPMLTSAITPRVGCATLSPFVSLDTPS